MKKFFALSAILLSIFAFISCSDDDDGSAGDYALSDLYGYTFEGSITTSGEPKRTLTPQLIIYDSTHLTWNMSSSGMSDKAFFYSAEKTATNNYKLTWYSSESDLTAKTNAGMTVTLGINSLENITVLVSNETEVTEGAGSAMAGKPVEMTRTSDAIKTYSGSGDKTDETKKSSEVTGIYGTWYGSTHASSNYFSGYDGTNEALTISENDGGTAKVSMTGTGFSCAWTFESVTVAEENGVTTLSGTGKATMSMGGSGSGNDYDATFSGTVGTDGKLNATFTVPTVMGGTTVTYTSN